MQNAISADTGSEAIRALREEGREPVFTVDEHKGLAEIMSEIDWTQFEGEGRIDNALEATREPVYHLDDDYGMPVRWIDSY